MAQFGFEMTRQLNGTSGFQFCWFRATFDVPKILQSPKTMYWNSATSNGQKYSKFMVGVDLFDMLKGLYTIDRRGYQFYYRLCHYFYSVCSINAWLLSPWTLQLLNPRSNKDELPNSHNLTFALTVFVIPWRRKSLTSNILNLRRRRRAQNPRPHRGSLPNENECQINKAKTQDSGSAQKHRQHRNDAIPTSRNLPAAPLWN